MAMYLKGVLIALRGLPTTLYVSVIAVIIGIIFGMILAMMKLSESKIARGIANVYIEIFRSTPMIVQALIMAYGIPMILQAQEISFKWPTLIIPAIIVCSLNSAAYMAEVMRSGIQAVDAGQIEAALSLGMTKGQLNRLVIWPQAIRICIPALGNEFITMIKETSILSYVGVTEVLRSAALWNAASFETFPAYIGAAVVYFCICFPLSKIVSILEKRMEGKDQEAAVMTANKAEREQLIDAEVK